MLTVLLLHKPLSYILSEYHIYRFLKITNGCKFDYKFKQPCQRSSTKSPVAFFVDWEWLFRLKKTRMILPYQQQIMHQCVIFVWVLPHLLPWTFCIRILFHHSKHWFVVVYPVTMSKEGRFSKIAQFSTKFPGNWGFKYIHHIHHISDRSPTLKFVFSNFVSFN